MPTSSVQSSLIPAACIAGVVFGISTAPLAMYRSEVVAVELQNRPLFAAEVRDLAGPYLGLTGIMSVSIGASIMGFSGWCQASRKSVAAESKLSRLQQDLLTQQAKLEAIKFSEARLQAQNLGAFLEPQSPVEAVSQQVQKPPLAAVPNPASTQVPAAAQNTLAGEFRVAAMRNTEEAAYVSYPKASHGPAPATLEANGVKDKAVMALSAAQSYASYARSTNTNSPSASGGQTDLQGTQLDHLLVQLKELATQVEELRSGTNGLAA